MYSPTATKELLPTALPAAQLAQRLYSDQRPRGQAVNQIGILIIDDDEASQAALRQVLDEEGWTVRIVPLANQAMAVLASGNYKLVIVNVVMAGLSGPLFTTLKELALSPPVEAGGHPGVRVLFLVPELAAPEAQPALEHEQLPYSLKPFHLHDFLEKVSDLLLETGAIPQPIRRVHHEHKSAERNFARERPASGDRRLGRNRRQTSMFAARDDYMMTEEEMLEFEKQEKEEQEHQKKKKKQLGLP